MSEDAPNYGSHSGSPLGAASGYAPFALEPSQSRDAETLRHDGGNNTMAVMSSSESVEWPTPQWLFDALDKEFGFTLDPCSRHDNAKCKKHFTREDNGLLRSWGEERVYMNPPYGAEIKAWMAKAYGASREGALVVCLVPARTDTEWWHDYAMRGEIRLLRGRVKFVGSENSAPFPSAIVVFRPQQFSLSCYNPRAGLPGSSGSSKADERTTKDHNGAQEHNARLCDGAK